MKTFCLRGTDIQIAKKAKKENIPIRYILEKNNYRKLANEEIVIEISRGSPTQSTGRSVFITNEFLNYLGSNLICSNFCRVLKPKLEYPTFLYSTIQLLYGSGLFFRYENSSNGVKNLDLSSLFVEEKIVLPPKILAKNYSAFLSSILKYVNRIGQDIELTDKFKIVLLSKMAK